MRLYIVILLTPVATLITKLMLTKLCSNAKTFLKKCIFVELILKSNHTCFITLRTKTAAILSTFLTIIGLTHVVLFVINLAINLLPVLQKHVYMQTAMESTASRAVFTLTQKLLHDASSNF